MGEERRTSPRYRCRIPCSAEMRGKAAEGNVLDVSNSGLSVTVTGLEIDQGDALRLTLTPRGLRGPSFPIEVLAWNVRRGRDKSTGEPMARVGCVLSEPSDDFLALVTSLAPKKSESKAPAKRMRPVTSAGKAMAAKAEVERAAPGGTEDKELAKAAAPVPEVTAPPVANTAERQFAVRLQLTGSPRTRRVIVIATGSNPASELARAELGEEWQVLEVSEV